MIVFVASAISFDPHTRCGEEQEIRMNKGVVVGIGVFAIACVVYLVAGMSGGEGSGEEAGGADEAKAGAGAGEANAEGGGKDAPKVKKEEVKADEPKDEKKDLALPGQLPKLKLPELPATALPAKPHSDMKIEGDLAEVDAEMAFRSVFPKLRSCYVELRQRAPQAKGRMLMRVRVSKGDAGKGQMGELYLKETQFTDPKYLTCIRDSIDNTKFKLDKTATNGTMEFTMFLTPEDVSNHEKESAKAGG